VALVYRAIDATPEQWLVLSQPPEAACSSFSRPLFDFAQRPIRGSEQKDVSDESEKLQWAARG
jgi:hypothetical protein